MENKLKAWPTLANPEQLFKKWQGRGGGSNRIDSLQKQVQMANVNSAPCAGVKENRLHLVWDWLKINLMLLLI